MSICYSYIAHQVLHNALRETPSNPRISWTAVELEEAHGNVQSSTRILQAAVKHFIDMKPRRILRLDEADLTALMKLFSKGMDRLPEWGKLWVLTVQVSLCV